MSTAGRLIRLGGLFFSQQVFWLEKDLKRFKTIIVYPKKMAKFFGTKGERQLIFEAVSFRVQAVKIFNSISPENPLPMVWPPCKLVSRYIFVPSSTFACDFIEFLFVVTLMLQMKSYHSIFPFFCWLSTSSPGCCNHRAHQIQRLYSTATKKTGTYPSQMPEKTATKTCSFTPNT